MAKQQKKTTTIRSDGFPDIAFERGLPASEDAERSILGAILLDNAAYDEAEAITYNDFSLDSHRRIFAAMAKMIEDGHPVDIITLSEYLRNQHEIQAVGGVAYLASLTEGLPRRLSIGEYVRIVKEKSQLRRLINVCGTAITIAADQSTNADELLTETDLRLLEITAQSVNEPEPIAAISANELRLIEEERASRITAVGIPSGFEPLDDALGGGWAEGELAVIGGKPGQGKSSLLTQTLVQCGRSGIPAHCFQLEMTKSQMIRRMLAAMTGLETRLFKHAAFMSSAEIERVREAQRELASFPLVIDVNSYLTRQQIISRARISKRRYKTRFFGLDYIQRIRFEEKAEFRHLEVGEIAKSLASFAKEEHVAVVALSSLTEKGGRSAEAEPVLADLRQSGDIQYETSSAILIHRERDENNEFKRLGKLIIAKQRNGVMGDVAAYYNHSSIFESERSKKDKQRAMEFAS